MKNRLMIRLLLLLCTVWLLGCGQKGPLYLPDKQEQPADSKASDSPDT
jgi:predicted small lipoprotein YifL